VETAAPLTRVPCDERRNSGTVNDSDKIGAVSMADATAPTTTLHGTHASPERIHLAAAESHAWTATSGGYTRGICNAAIGTESASQSDSAQSLPETVDPGRSKSAQENAIYIHSIVLYLWNRLRMIQMLRLTMMRRQLDACQQNNGRCR